jgi:hypothetical protein
VNLFILHTDPVIAATLNCDTHVCKIILESAQMLCLAHWAENTPAPYHSKSQMNNPISAWVRQTKANYEWTLRHAHALLIEYTHRYNKIHKTTSVVEWCDINRPALADSDLTPFHQSMPDYCKRQDPVEAYRTYYIHEKWSLCRWTNTPIPIWFTQGLNQLRQAEQQPFVSENIAG